MGYAGARIILKCDQESPIAAVQQEVVKNRPDVATVPRHSPVGESQSNGRVENAIRRVQEQVRAFTIRLKHALSVTGDRSSSLRMVGRMGSNDVDKIRDQR